VRNGPNPRNGQSPGWFLGDGKLHSVRLSGGQARQYRNRWVRTRSFLGETTLYGPDGKFDLTARLANTHVVRSRDLRCAGRRAAVRCCHAL